ncbi:GDSL-type esterase/lipase family protein [Plantactinospora sp. KLBMP9567]|uniref:GDSL-type esterase/lipase family protein n=1 Tax=Plantactinospora sp. KLBMP9567 TaxID=3085900 RepID=UPI0029819FE0|nr:SGNH/GDSL hydrolase family protein [Plantactinospora sp. KLBMP9567]MDW5326082.1 GDSL-type esterase/lipase family protein [Plantactinospora sp. KLBMP9567]
MSAPRRTATLLSTLLAAVVFVTSVGLVASPAHADPGPPPASMASLGDSITRGFNACGWYVDCPSRSFSTGDDAGVNSHYLRIRAVNPAINGRNHNDAESGAESADMAGQADAAVSQGVGYVTMLIGANDACASSESGMTPVSTFRSNIDAALGRLRSGLPNARVFVISVPDIQRLWSVGRGNFAARTAWSLFGICQSMLANPTSTAQADVDRRSRVRQRVVDYNSQLAQACAAYGSNCVFDGNAVFNYPFALGQLSGWDYFHPNASGQQVLAEISYGAGFRW